MINTLVFRTFQGLQASREALPDMAMPAIAWEPGYGGHYIAVLSLRGRGEGGTATIHDPNEPNTRTVGQEKLLQACGGFLLTLHR